MTRRLLALSLPAGPAFVAALRRAWDEGDAVLPVDPRLPRPAIERLLDAIRPTHHLGTDGRLAPLTSGIPVAEGDALVVATSGTTGDPKGVVLTRAAVTASALATSARLAVDPTADHWLACLPLSHIGGLSVVTRALLTGTRLTVLDGFRPEAVDASPATRVSLVATALRRIAPSRWRTIVLGGSAPPAELPPNVVTTYGMTETGSGIVYDGNPLEGVEVRVDGSGHIHVRAPMLLRAYRSTQDPSGFDPRSPDGWFATGDAGAFVDGRLVVRGRIGDVIVSGGEKVWPDALERVLLGVPGVAEVGVTGLPDAEWGARVVAVVVAGPDGAPTLDALRDAARAELGPWTAPKQLVVVSSLPRTALGKLRRNALGSLVLGSSRTGPA